MRGRATEHRHMLNLTAGVATHTHRHHVAAVCVCYCNAIFVRQVLDLWSENPLVCPRFQANPAILGLRLSRLGLELSLG